MRDGTQTDSENTSFTRHIDPTTDVRDGDAARAKPELVVRAASLKTAITQLKNLTEFNAKRSSQEALAANLIFLRHHGVDDEILDLVVEMTLSQDVDEEMTAAINYMSSGFLLALLTLEEERTSNG